MTLVFCKKKKKRMACYFWFLHLKLWFVTGEAQSSSDSNYTNHKGQLL